jgi:hypothetical protein
MSSDDDTQNNDKDAYVLRFSHNIIEHLGLKLYQNKPTNVIAELVSNSWDADSEAVWVHLYNNAAGGPESIMVADNGLGMSADELRSKYLVVGKPKRPKDDPGVATAGGRTPMGRKGIGKLAPFGVARIIDLLTISGGKLNWLRFNYDEITNGESDFESLSQYKPEVLAKDLDIDEVLTTPKLSPEIATHLNHIKSSTKRGTLIWAQNLTLQRPILPTTMLESLGRRFTVTLARPDFVVKVNDTQIAENHVFPPWELRIPPTGSLTADIDTPLGTKKISYWAGFVGEAAWSSDESGVGIYAHGKIAQDRPFTFFNKGSEIFTRYLYAVVEADWIDELEIDAISTDRTSIDWESPDFSTLKIWGDKELKSWVKQYQDLKKQKAKEENTQLVDQVLAKQDGIKLRPAEKEHLVTLLSDVTPRMGKDTDNKEKLVEATAKAWLHEPARKLIKELWSDASQFDVQQFSNIVHKLNEQLIPESLSLAVVFSQRVFALTELNNHIALSKETQLQKLIEEFPWILKNDYERMIPRTNLKNICEEAINSGVFPYRQVHSEAGNTLPDMVFFGDANDKVILIVELKGPEIVASWAEEEQLSSYVKYIKSRYPTSEVHGLLVSGSFDEAAFEASSKLIETTTWDLVLKKSRRDHMELLAALLAGSDADEDDARVQQICELGGKTVTAYLQEMRERVPELEDLFQKLALKK